VLLHLPALNQSNHLTIDPIDIHTTPLARRQRPADDGAQRGGTLLDDERGRGLRGRALGPRRYAYVRLCRCLQMIEINGSSSLFLVG